MGEAGEHTGGVAWGGKCPSMSEMETQGSEPWDLGVCLASFSCLIAWVPFQALCSWCEGSRPGLCAHDSSLRLGAEYGHSFRSNDCHGCLLRETIRLCQTSVWQDGTGIDF